MANFVAKLSRFLEFFELDRRVLVHSPEKDLSRPNPRIESASFPDCERGAHCGAGTAAATQARIRNAKFFTSIPLGS